MTNLSPLARRQARWASWLVALILFFALFPASAGHCARGTRACPMAATAGKCACAIPSWLPYSSRVTALNPTGVEYSHRGVIDPGCRPSGYPHRLLARVMTGSTDDGQCQRKKLLEEIEMQDTKKVGRRRLLS